MARVFIDTSSLIKLYRTEPNSPAVAAVVSFTDSLLIAQITPLEFRSAFYGLVRQEMISVADALVYIGRFVNDMPQYELVIVDAITFARAQSLMDTYSTSLSLRPLDSLQLVCAHSAHAVNPLDLFATTDGVVAKIASAEGFTVRP